MMEKTKAFTLAEVLITLGIIGVVAAMTIPTLMSNVQKHTYVVALKKFYTTQMSGWSTLLADEGVSQLEDTSVFQSIVGDDCLAWQDTNANCSAFYNNLKKYFRFSVITAPTYQTHLLNGQSFMPETGQKVYLFSDGSIGIDSSTFLKKAQNPDDAATLAQINAGGYHMRTKQSEFWIDVNGFKKPNIIGRDIFLFELSGDGKLYPQLGKDEEAFSGNAGTSWVSDNKWCGAPNSTDASASNGFCAARIMDEGWQMNY